MLEIKECVSKDTCECCFVTKDNVVDFIKYAYPRAKDEQIEIGNNIATVRFSNYYSWSVILNKWYVNESKLGWVDCTKEQFNRNYSINDETEKKIHNEAIESCLLTIQKYRDKHSKDRNEYPINYGTLLDFENMFRDLMIKD